MAEEVDQLRDKPYVSHQREAKSKEFSQTYNQGHTRQDSRQAEPYMEERRDLG